MFEVKISKRKRLKLAMTYWLHSTKIQKPLSEKFTCFIGNTSKFMFKVILVFSLPCTVCEFDRK